MRDLSDNRYLDMRPVPLCEYDLFTFFYKDFAVETKTSSTKILLEVSSLLALMRFDIRVFGFKLLSMLVASYLVKPDYDLSKTITYIADINGVTDQIAIDGLEAVLAQNVCFTDLAHAALGRRPIPAGERFTVAEAVEIIGAIFKIFFNYTTDDTLFEYELCPQINLFKIGVQNGN